MSRRRGLAFAVPLLIVGITGQFAFPRVIASTQIASITAIILAVIVAYCALLLLEKRGVVPPA